MILSFVHNVINLDKASVECEEIWGYCCSKQKNVPDEHKGKPGYGDVWTCTALDADSKADRLTAGRGARTVAEIAELSN